MLQSIEVEMERPLNSVITMHFQYRFQHFCISIVQGEASEAGA
jgi:hypothetical protein